MRSRPWLAQLARERLLYAAIPSALFCRRNESLLVLANQFFRLQNNGLWVIFTIQGTNLFFALTLEF